MNSVVYGILEALKAWCDDNRPAIETTVASIRKGWDRGGEKDETVQEAWAAGGTSDFIKNSIERGRAAQEKSEMCKAHGCMNRAAEMSGGFCVAHYTIWLNRVAQQSGAPSEYPVRLGARCDHGNRPPSVGEEVVTVGGAVRRGPNANKDEFPEWDDCRVGSAADKSASGRIHEGAELGTMQEALGQDKELTATQQPKPYTNKEIDNAFEAFINSGEMFSRDEVERELEKQYPQRVMTAKVWKNALLRAVRSGKLEVLERGTYQNVEGE